MNDLSSQVVNDVAREARKWLRYYRDLGFTSLVRSPAPLRDVEDQPAGIEAASAALVLPPISVVVPESFVPPIHSNPIPKETTLPRPKLSVGTSTVAVSAISNVAAGGRRETLEAIRADIGEDCQRCALAGGRKTIVFGSGNAKAELVFVGEGPGADEDEQGLPFVGRAGQLLTDMIEKGLKIPRPEVYICNIVKCRPPKNRKPEPDEIAACRQFVERQIAAINPKVICAMGATAAETLLGVKQSMGSLRGTQYEFAGIPLIVTYHPAFLLRDPSRKVDTWADLKMVLALLKK